MLTYGTLKRCRKEAKEKDHLPITILQGAMFLFGEYSLENCAKMFPLQFPPSQGYN